MRKIGEQVLYATYDISDIIGLYRYYEFGSKGDAEDLIKQINEAKEDDLIGSWTPSGFKTNKAESIKWAQDYIKNLGDESR